MYTYAGLSLLPLFSSPKMKLPNVVLTINFRIFKYICRTVPCAAGKILISAYAVVVSFWLIEPPPAWQSWWSVLIAPADAGAVGNSSFSAFTILTHSSGDIGLKGVRKLFWKMFFQGPNTWRMVNWQSRFIEGRIDGKVVRSRMGQKVNSKLCICQCVQKERWTVSVTSFMPGKLWL